MKITPNENAGAQTAAPANETATTPAVVEPGLNAESVAVFIADAPAILQQNQNSVQRAVDFGKTLLNKINTEGMSAELDAQCNDFLVRNRKTHEDINKRRSPVTQFLNQIIKEFTTLENQIDPKKGETVAAKIQNARDEFARKTAEEIRVKEAEAQRKLQAEKEKIQLKADTETQLNKHFNDHLNVKAFDLQNIFGTVSLQNYEHRLQQLHEFPTAYEFKHFDAWLPRLMPIYCTQAELQNIVTNVKLGKYEQFNILFQNTIADKRMGLIDRMPSVLTELKEAAKREEEERLRIEELRKKDAAAAQLREAEAQKERERLAEIQKQRDEEARLKLAAEAEQRAAAAANNVEATRQADLTEALFDAQVITAEAPKQTAQVREGFEIIVNNQLGFLLLAQFYFEKEGKGEAIEKLEKKTLASMKKFAENYAHKSDGKEKIVSPFLTYTEKFTTVATKRK